MLSQYRPLQMSMTQEEIVRGRQSLTLGSKHHVMSDI